MFRLQRLEITGFKSFADYTELVFTGDGITAVVGPNGCGKSNVADAISWVLGEQRAKQLRGAEMKDVIFQGARNRAASGMAEVVLHLVRDETVEEEPDIDDIDSALEEIDEQTEVVEGKFSPDVLGEAVPFEAPRAGNPSVVQLTGGASGGEAAIFQSGGNGELSVTASGSPIDAAESAHQGETEGSTSTAAGAEGEAGGAITAKARHKRHWRPRRMALEFGPGESVAVTRRLYGSGESEYLLNNRQCRLRDIQDLFSGTGLAGAHYAIIEQGRIGQILSAKPMDRRTLIEEAAGITKFRVRQRAAEARLEGARTNLHRISDIISEIERQANSLRRQASKARRYAQLREELRDLLRRVYVADEHALVTLLSELQSQLLETSEEERSLAATLEAGEDEARRATAEAREIEEQLSAARAEVAESTLQRDRRERERVYQQEQITTLEGRIAGVVREIEGVRARVAQVETECDGLRAVEVQVRDASEETARLLEAAETAHAERMAEVLDAEEKIELARAALLTHTAVAERLMEIGRQLESALERLAAQAEGLEREGERAATAYEAAKIAAENLQVEVTESRARLDAHVAEREDAAREVAAARAVVAETVAAHERVRDEAARVRHRLDTLAELDAQHALYSQAVQRIFSHDEPDKAPKDFHSIATLADVLRVEPRWERAVESVFGSYLQSVIVPTPDDAARAAAWLQANDAGRATFLVAGLHGGAEESAASSGHNAGTALIEDGTENDSDSFDARIGDLLGAPREIAAVLGRTLPREINARIVKDLDQAMMRSLATGEMFVTARGEWVAGGQLLAAGGPLSAGDGAGLLAFKREMRDLGARYTGLEADLLFAEQSASGARERLGQLEDAYLLLNEVIGREEREHVARELTGTQLVQDIERAGRHMRVVADDAARLAEERRLLDERNQTQKTEAEAAEHARLAATQEVMQAAELLSAARRAAEAESERLSKQRAAAATASERRRATTAELKRMEAEEGDLHARLERHAEDLNEMESRLTDLRRSIAQMDEGAEQVDGERAACERKVEQVAGRLAEARERADVCSSRLTDLRHQAAAVRDARATLEVRRAEASARLNYVREACVHDLAQTPEELARGLEAEDDFDLESARAHVEELRARLEGFGAVNMMALEELAEAEDRLQFLIAQRQDITDGIISTDEALREIKRRSRERFRHAFEEINRNFGKFFVELFGGGRGEMNLLDTADVLESGIDITAQPPGKRLQNVLLLSGGEKAMAALALVLAIFRYRPSPFCLLDEVDAPLDEANIGRFTNKITEMSADTQFIVITHNKRTMEVARALYGVTMEDAGISKLVSVRFE